MLLEQEGIYAEPAGAAALAGWIRAIGNGIVGAGDAAVCLVTGHGFKDPASVERAVLLHPTLTVPADAVLEKLAALI